MMHVDFQVAEHSRWKIINNQGFSDKFSAVESASVHLITSEQA